MRGQTGTDGSGLPGQAVLPADEKGLLDDADPALLGGHPEPGVARGLRPDRKRLPHAARLLEGGVGEAPPEVGGLGVGVGVLPEVAGQGAPEGLRPQGRLEHPEEGAPLGVADGVEDLVDLPRIPHGDLDGMGGGQGVHLQGLVPVLALEELPHPPLREEGVHRLDLHPGRESLVEPEVVPPVHGDEVPEPLVGHLVGHDDGHPLEVPGGGPGGRRKQGRLPEGHGPPVLHGAGGEVGNRDQIELGERIGNPEVVVVPGKEPGRRVEGEPALLRPPDGGVDRDFDPRRTGRDPVPAPHRQVQEVGGHPGGALEDDRLETLGSRGPAPLRHVRKRRVPFGHDGGDGEGGLHAGLVEAGEGASRVGRLELGGRHHQGPALRVLSRAPVEPGEKVVDLSGEGDLEPHPLPLLEHAPGGQDDPLRVRKEADFEGIGEPLVEGLGPGDREPLRVQHELDGAPADLEVDPHLARKGRKVLRGMQGHVVVAGQKVGGKLVERERVHGVRSWGLRVFGSLGKGSRGSWPETARWSPWDGLPRAG
ncbi:MAG: hypothetical protein M1537_06970 [Nitrospirae bacterium]|nr:hypothetical protein [Nitrospirota bacterium]